MNVLLNIPSHAGCVNCGECCGVIPATDSEIQAIRTFLDKHSDIRNLAVKQSGRPFDCPFRDNEKQQCSVYPVRPIICRLCGVCKGMTCKYGNSSEIDGNSFLGRRPLDEYSILNFEDWR